MGESSSSANRTFFLVDTGCDEAELVESAVLMEEAFLVAAFGRATFLRTLRSRSY